MSALRVDGLSKAFGGLHVTRGVNLDVQPGERRLIIGPNGAGKTTLFNLITGELTPDSGSITLFGPIVGATLVVVVKNVVSGYIERWNMLLGAIFVAIVILMPEGLVPGSTRLWRLLWRRRAKAAVEAKP